MSRMPAQKAVIQRLVQDIQSNGTFRTDLLMTGAEGQPVVFGPMSLLDRREKADGYEARVDAEIRKWDGWRRLSLVNNFARAAGMTLFIPRVLEIAGVRSVDELPGREVMCVRYTAGEGTRAWEIASLDGSKAFSVDRDADRLSRVITKIERAYRGVFDKEPAIKEPMPASMRRGGM